MRETKKDVSQDIWCYCRDTNSILSEIPMYSDTAALACSVSCGFQSRLLLFYRFLGQYHVFACLLSSVQGGPTNCLNKDVGYL